MYVTILFRMVTSVAAFD